MRIRFVPMFIALAVALTGLLGFTTATAQAADKDCGDFATQKAAQTFYINHGGPQSDPHGLDAEGDGVACEGNPCPCSTDQGGGGGGGDNGGGGNPEPKPKRAAAKIIRVVDGDTAKVKYIGGGKATVRFLGIDTPEVFGGEECGGPEASEALKNRLPRGTRVVLISDTSQDLKDRYGRQLRYVEKKGTDVGRAMIFDGKGEVYVYQGNPFNRVKAYRKAQDSAKDADRGIWGAC
ncbi:Thermonuclease [Nocardioides aquaticus]|uniref:Thermonuclease n=1 Tax=Nocardioides aquaticus TaxID=160826 RepID=A0ABX8EM73_9ACTN|nr:thermonuclease family protein [Nocardioides aquaticus]QVT79728.1 Thermonuclease [Nocardioides aquaticus]